MKLRPNQIEPVEKGVAFFNQKKASPSIIVAPTAFGKSIVKISCNSTFKGIIRTKLQ